MRFAPLFLLQTDYVPELLSLFQLFRKCRGGNSIEEDGGQKVDAGSTLELEKILIVSLLAVFKDLLPSYRIHHTHEVFGGREGCGLNVEHFLHIFISLRKTQ